MTTHKFTLCTHGFRHGGTHEQLELLAEQLTKAIGDFPQQVPLHITYTQEPYHKRDNPDGLFGTFSVTRIDPSTPLANSPESGEPPSPATPIHP